MVKEFLPEWRAGALVAYAFLLASAACDAPEVELAPTALPVGDEPSMTLGVTTHFSHGWSPDILEQADALAISTFRDALRWEQIEKSAGTYVFDKWRTEYPDAIAERDGSLSITLLGTNPLYDDGQTVSSSGGIAALGSFVAAAIERFPSIEIVEVGNEINAENFVSGAFQSADYPQRAELYTQMLRGVHEAAKTANPDVLIAGGAVHSIPVDFLQQVFAAGAGAYMDVLVIHPYTTEPEMLSKELALMKARLPEPVPPIEVSEFSVATQEGAADYLIKMVTVMASVGIERVHWYALAGLGKSRTAVLFDDEGTITPAGRAFRVAQSNILSFPVENVSPDAYSYVFKVGDRTLVMWGEPRAITYPGQAVAAFSADGTALEAPPEMLSMDRVSILTTNSAITLGTDVVLGASPILADSFHDFSLQDAGDGQARGDDPFERFFRRVGTEIDLKVMGGGDRKSSLWTPYLATRFHRPMYLKANGMVPGSFGATRDNMTNVDVVHRFTAPRAMTVAVRTDLSPSGRSTDGVKATILLNGTSIYDEVIRDRVTNTTPPLALEPGDSVEIVVGANGDPRGDATEYRFQILDR